ncbi:MAG: hypothetical protein SVS85_03690, partial [Candidatus Nanohaloarchaea archaeon]|nr:hypothetical protein [Candidatus Nanohaloarchaea archaeon]
TTLSINNSAGQYDIDMNENLLLNVNALQEGTGTDTLRFDGSNNVNIPNGRLDISDNRVENTDAVHFSGREGGNADGLTDDGEATLYQHDGTGSTGSDGDLVIYSSDAGSGGD